MTLWSSDALCNQGLLCKLNSIAILSMHLQ